jgi:hypothetical protein
VMPFGVKNLFCQAALAYASGPLCLQNREQEPLGQTTRNTMLNLI